MDVKPENILLTNGFNIKLSDLGITKILKSKEETADTFIGTL